MGQPASLRVYAANHGHNAVQERRSRAEEEGGEEAHVPLPDAGAHEEAVVVQSEGAPPAPAAVPAAVGPPEPTLAAELLLPKPPVRQPAAPDAAFLLTLCGAGVPRVGLRCARVHEVAGERGEDSGRAAARGGGLEARGDGRLQALEEGEAVEGQDASGEQRR
eukprot:CAMPEP_0204561664 /NCGR_PEP_ID=MMETSP0661-20131031/33315_1 /ASSEMBLY_ACC=CAM_ASM_000606 /TAXON_ID=109239 /ORGANISM="Alexandrium margalefi, Strain AMGDE01CS-322" /LENGTH=162 /DNA_ID=CAMNT_0051569091 /DNA_START=433 /DNA_END=917 /DNA_ORIENTATION=-